MNPARTILAVVAAAGLIVTAAPLWADSAAPTGNAADFLNGITCPDPNNLLNPPCYNPNASGTKLAGTLSVVYDETSSGCVTNVFVNLTLQQGNLLLPFTTDYVNGVRPHPGFPGGSCFSPGDNQSEQVKVIIDLIRVLAIPIFSSCTQPACPSFQVKAITNFVSTTGPLSQFSDGFSADVTIAVH